MNVTPLFLDYVNTNEFIVTDTYHMMSHDITRYHMLSHVISSQTHHEKIVLSNARSSW